MGVSYAVYEPESAVPRLSGLFMARAGVGYGTQPAADSSARTEADSSQKQTTLSLTPPTGTEAELIRQINHRMYRSDYEGALTLAMNALDARALSAPTREAVLEQARLSLVEGQPHMSEYDFQHFQMRLFEAMAPSIKLDSPAPSGLKPTVPGMAI